MYLKYCMHSRRCISIFMLTDIHHSFIQIKVNHDHPLFNVTLTQYLLTRSQPVWKGRHPFSQWEESDQIFSLPLTLRLLLPFFPPVMKYLEILFIQLYKLLTYKHSLSERERERLTKIMVYGSYFVPRYVGFLKKRLESCLKVEI